MDLDGDLEQPDTAASEAEVMLFDGWDFTPVRFPPAQAPKGAIGADQDPPKPNPAD
jgi:hypothetical protein